MKKDTSSWSRRLCATFALFVSSACGDSATAPTTVVTPPPSSSEPTGGTIEICLTTNPSPAVISAGGEITLNASCSHASSELVRFDWDLGDGRSRSGVVIHPRYPDAGTYRVRLTVGDAEGQSASSEVEVRVEVPLLACMAWSRAPGDDPELAPCGFRFDASCSTGDIVEYRWFFQGDPNWSDFEDATVTTTEPQVGYTWREDIECVAFRPFERIVRLTVVDASGRTSTVEELVQVARPLRDP